MKEKGCRLIPAVLAASLLFYLFLAWAVPYCITDDFQWGTDQGVRWWLYGLLNGRYAGNLCALLMCHFEWVKVLLMGGCMFLIPFLIAVLMCRGERARFLPIFLLSNMLILLMPGMMWIEVYGWVSGFGNYGVSAVVFLAFLLLVREAHRRRTHPGRWAAALFFGALVMGLFVETQSILFLGMTLVTGIYASVRDRPLRLPFWAAFAGSALGAALMFSNGVVAELMGQGAALNGLRNLTFAPGSGPLTMAVSILKWYLHRLLPIAFLRGPHMALPMAIIIGMGFWNSRFRPLAVLAALPLWTHWLLWSTNDYVTYSHSAAGCLCWAVTFLALLACRGEGDRKLRRLLLFLVAPLDLLPLAATTTLGHRFYFLPMVVLIMLASDLAAPVAERRAAVRAVAGCMAVLMAVWGYRSRVVAGCTRLREELIRTAVREEADRVVLPSDRYFNVVWPLRDPSNAEYASYFRDHYGIPREVTLVFLPAGSYETWPDYTPEQWERRVVLEPSDDFVSSLP